MLLIYVIMFLRPFGSKRAELERLCLNPSYRVYNLLICFLLIC